MDCVQCPSFMPFNIDNYGLDVNFMNLIVEIVLYANVYVNTELRHAR